MTILANSSVATRLPVKDLARARRFYSGKLGLEPAEQRPGGLLYRCASGCFVLFESAGSPRAFVDSCKSDDQVRNFPAA
jgi:catechol 2,3-dioxygenase-like lactoylglutathione lyase family enzyme